MRPSTAKTPAKLLLALSAAVLLSGCVSLFPKADPVQLYRFTGRADPNAAAPALDGARVGVGLGPVGFDRAAAGDRILTVTGSQAAYVADARWVAPAQTLFNQALEDAFERRAAAARLVGRGEVTASSLLLDVDVRTFEARYLGGPEAAPTAVVAVRARLMRYPDRAVVGERIFEASAPAADNRVSAIVPAFDAAAERALGELITWTDAAVR
jgi:cholesterol transport system auxiliary component